MVNSFRLPLTALFMAVLLIGCENPAQENQQSAAEEVKQESVSSEKINVVTVEEVYLTERNEADNIDSPAYWHGQDYGSENWVISTAKDADALVVTDAVDGSNIKRIGRSGNGDGDLAYPNGVAVIDNYCFVVERDNHRVQAFSLPDFTQLGTFGDTELIRPYGLYIHKLDNDEYNIYITDAYESPNGDNVPMEEMGERVKIYNVTKGDGKIVSEYVKSFGETSEKGAIRVPESIWGDPENDILLIAEEDRSINNIKVYNLDGNFTGKTIGDGIFKHQAEGIVLYRTSDGGGYWVTTDQVKTAPTIFHVFDRRTFELLGSFSGKTTVNTDGIAITQKVVGPYTTGMFFAIHDDGNVGAFDWKQVADALSLPTHVE